MNDSVIPNLNTGKDSALHRLAILGILSTILYTVILYLSSRFEYGSPKTERPIVMVLVFFSTAFVVYLFGIRLANKAVQNGRLLMVIVGSALVFRLIMVFSTPIQEIDIYRYLWDGEVCAQGVSPFRYSPHRVRISTLESTSDPELTKLLRHRNTSPELTEILRRIHHDELPTIYPPVSQVVFTLVTVSTPDGATVTERLLAMKCWLMVFDLATLLIVIGLLKQCKKPVGLCLIYAWCPLLIKEFANSGHLDSIAVFLTTLAVYIFVRLMVSVRSDARTQTKTRTMFPAIGSSIILALAVGAKLYAVILVPLFFLSILKFIGWRRTVVPFFVFIVASFILFWPMLPNKSDRDESSTSPTQLTLPLAESIETDPSEGLTTFLRRWEMNDFLFLLMIENVKPATNINPDRAAWFSIVPEEYRRHLITVVTSRIQVTKKEAPFLVARTFTSSVFIVIAFALARRAVRDNTLCSFCESAFLTLAWFWLLCPTQNPWYWTWALPLLPFARSRVWLGVAGIAMIYYLRFWLAYHWPVNEVLNTGYDGKLFFDFVVTWIEFAPWFVALAVEFYLFKRNKKNA